MTDFHSSHKTSWKKAEVSQKWRSFLATFVILLLLLGVFNGVLKTVNLGRNVGTSKWDGQSPFSAVINTNPTSVVVYNPNTKKFAQFALNDDIYVETGDVSRPLLKLSDAKDTKELTRAVSHVLGATVTNYVVLANKQKVSEENMQVDFKNFASVLFPFKIVMGVENFKDTNVSQLDLFRLWWQAKSLGLSSLSFSDVGRNTEDIILAGGEKVMGVDNETVHRQISPVLENSKILDEGKSVDIVNGTRDAIWARFSAQYVSAFGANVVKVSDSGEALDKTTVLVSKNSYTASYLAKVFNCDIKSVPNFPEDKVQLIIGRDFTQNF